MRALVGIGSNLGHPRRRIAMAQRALARLPRTRVLAVSPNYLTAPQGTSDAQPDYVNAVAMLRTALAPRALLRHLQSIERRAGRTRVAGARNSARTLDLDLLLFGRRRMRGPQLVLPHPRMHERAFVLQPLRDVMPAAIIPGHGVAGRLLPRLRGQRVVRTHRRHL